MAGIFLLKIKSLEKFEWEEEWDRDYSTGQRNQEPVFLGTWVDGVNSTVWLECKCIQCSLYKLLCRTHFTPLSWAYLLECTCFQNIEKQDCISFSYLASKAFKSKLVVSLFFLFDKLTSDLNIIYNTHFYHEILHVLVVRTDNWLNHIDTSIAPWELKPGKHCIAPKFIFHNTIRGVGSP